MARINRKYIDKHWLSFVLRGGVAIIFGALAIFGALNDFNLVITMLVVYLLIMGVIDATSALYSTFKKRGWINSVIDALIDVVTAIMLVSMGQNNLAMCMIILSAYTLISGVIDIFHGFLSTVDPTDRFIRILAGIIGTVTAFVILNSAGFEDIMTFARFFGVYLLVVGITSLIYGIHNRSQNIEDLEARREARKAARKSTTKKKSEKKAKK